MLQILYSLAFTVLAFFAIGNLIRNLMQFSMESTHGRSRAGTAKKPASVRRTVPHPELFDNNGRAIDEPLLVMRSISVEDARQKLDDLYKSSPGVRSNLADEEA
ncbi:MAG: DUF2973 domain-containing protein [Cyanobacteriota bacterium]|nr:DUF2973 domain-containing protein [Cyanobacteriota bacterium]